MLENDKSSILNKPEILRRETLLTQPVKKGKGWIFKLILILIALGFIFYLYTHPEGIQNFTNKFLDNLLK